MKRWVLGVFQLVVAATMVPQVFFFGVPGLLGSLGMSESGHFDADMSGVPRLYYWSLLIASLSLVIATILAFAGATLTLTKPSRFSIRACLAAAVFYWFFIAGSLVIAYALGIHFNLRYMTVWDVMEYPIGVAAAVVAYALYYQGKAGAIS
jgi:ABC-type Fe3+ transport system permease subunit